MVQRDRAGDLLLRPRGSWPWGRRRRRRAAAPAARRRGPRSRPARRATTRTRIGRDTRAAEGLGVGDGVGLAASPRRRPAPARSSPASPAPTRAARRRAAVKRLVASDAGRMLARLLPSRSAPISRSLSSVSCSASVGAGRRRARPGRAACRGSRVVSAVSDAGEAAPSTSRSTRIPAPVAQRARGAGPRSRRSMAVLVRWRLRPELCGQGRPHQAASALRRRADASPAPARAAGPRARGCRSRSWRCWRGRAASGSPAGRRRGRAGGWRRRGAACAARLAAASSPAMAGEILDEQEEALAGHVPAPAARREEEGRARARAARPRPRRRGGRARRRARRAPAATAAPCARARPCRARGSSADRRATAATGSETSSLTRRPVA